MKNYKMILISLLFLIFMVGAVSAADENVTDSLEITDEVSVDEEVVASSDVENDNVLGMSDEENMGFDFPPSDTPDMSLVKAEDTTVVYGEDTKFEATFVKTEFNPMPNEVPITNLSVVFEISNSSGDLIKQIDAITDEKGIASFDIDLPLGTYSIVSKNPASPTQTITNNIYVVTEICPTFIANNVTLVYGEEKTFIIKVCNPAGDPLVDEEITYEIDDDKGYVQPSGKDGVISFVIDLPVGSHTVLISKGNDFLNNYEELECSIIVLNESSIVIDDVPSEENTILISFTDIDGASLAGADVKVFVGENNYTITTNEKGIANFDLSALPLGDYNITILNPVTGQEVIRNVSLTADETVFADDVTVVYNDGSKFAANFTDKYGKALVNVSVVFTLNGEVINATTDESGFAFINTDLSAGSYDIVISNPVTGDEINKKLTITKLAVVLNAIDISMVYNVPKALVITLTDGQGNKLPDKNITISLNGKKYNKVTSDEGQVKLSVNLNAKSYGATISFDGDNNYDGAQTTTNIKVTKAAVKMTAKKATFKIKTKTKKYSIVLKDNKNKVMKKVKVTLKVKGKTYKATTNAKGKATFKITKLTKKGKYVANVKFAGNKNFKAVNKKVKITVKK